jgi:hypothetical protein
VVRTAHQRDALSRACVILGLDRLGYALTISDPAKAAGIAAIIKGLVSFP